MRRLETHDWWPDLVALKDDLSLRELAEKFNVTPGAISAAFKRTGTTRRPAPPGPRALRKPRPSVKKTTEELPPEAGEKEAASSAAESRPGSKDSKLEPHTHLLGQVPDSEIAELAGVSVRTVQNYRARHDIAGFNPSEAGRQRQSRIDPFVELLGKVPDRVVAEKAGVSINAVRHFRSKRGIPSVQGSDVVPTTTPAVASGESTQLAWSVSYRSAGEIMEGVVVAPSLVAAAEAASLRAPGPVVGIQWVGPVL